MAWKQLTFFTDQDHAEAISETLELLGALAVTLQEGGDDRVFEPLPGETPLWRQTRVLGLFESDMNLELVQSLLHSKFDAWIHGLEVSEVADQDWERAWLDDFKPMRFGKGLWIIPGAYEPPDTSAVNIFLDPGLAFGTGTHATTAMCLGWLDANPPRNKTVLDYGCGSGILAIAAAKLGASQVFGVDIDPQAIDATIQNATRNKIADKISVSLPDQLSQKTVDILLANILAKPLISFAKLFADLLRPDGQLVLSGILEEQAEQILEAYQLDFDLQVADNMDGWVLISGTRKSGDVRKT